MPKYSLEDIAADVKLILTRLTALSSAQATAEGQASLLTELEKKADVTEDQLVALKAYRSSDSTYQPARLDKATNSIQTIDYEHHEVHAGSHFFYTDSVALNDTGTQDYMITTPNTTKWAHLVFVASGSAITTVQIYEGSDKNGTTLQTVFNSDRNSATVATVTVHKGTSGGTTDGTLIWQRKSGAATQQSRTGMEATRGAEKILKQNTKYIIRITSGTNANLTNLALDWYEHTNII